MAPPSSAHAQPDDATRAPIQPSFEAEFCQHDGMVTMLMFYRRRASPKHCYSIIEVDYGGGGHRTLLKDQTINCCIFGVPPDPVYKGARGRPTGPLWRAPKRGILLGLQVLVGFHQKGERGKEGEGEGEGKGGAAPLS